MEECYICMRPILPDQLSGKWEGYLAHRDCIEQEEAADAEEMAGLPS